MGNSRLNLNHLISNLIFLLVFIIIFSREVYAFDKIDYGSQDDVLVARVNPDGSKHFYHPDHLGSTTLITNNVSGVVENTFYSPYGEILGGGMLL